MGIDEKIRMSVFPCIQTVGTLCLYRWPLGIDFLTREDDAG